MGRIRHMDAGVRRRFQVVVEATGLDYKAASLKGGFAATYVRDVIKKGRGKLDNVLDIVRKIAPDYVSWVHEAKGNAPPKSIARPATPVSEADEPESVQSERGNAANADQWIEIHQSDLERELYAALRTLNVPPVLAESRIGDILEALKGISEARASAQEAGSVRIQLVSSTPTDGDPSVQQNGI